MGPLFSGVMSIKAHGVIISESFPWTIEIATGSSLITQNFTERGPIPGNSRIIYATVSAGRTILGHGPSVNVAYDGIYYPTTGLDRELMSRLIYWIPVLVKLELYEGGPTSEVLGYVKSTLEIPYPSFGYAAEANSEPLIGSLF